MIRQSSPSVVPWAIGMILATAGMVAAQTCEPAWDHAVGNPGVNSTVFALLGVNESSNIGPALYVGGQFSTAGGQSAKNIAMWDGSNYAPLGTGAENGGIVYALAAGPDGNLYVGGAFGNMGGQAGTKRIAKWNGSAWSDVGGGMAENNAGIRALQFHGGDLYAGGYLNEIGGVTAHKLAVWNGDFWAPLPGDPLGLTDSVLALAVHDDGGGSELYVGGSFSSAGGNGHAAYVFKWNGSALQPLGRGANDDVEAFATFNGDLYVAGQFDEVIQADGTVVQAEKIARWDGAAWHAIGTGMGTSLSTHVWALATFDDGAGNALYAGGSFSAAGGQSISRLARWDGSSWIAPGGASLNGYVYALGVYAGAAHPGVFVGGTFSLNNGQTALRIDEWRGGRPAFPVNASATPPSLCAGESSLLTAAVTGAEIDWYAGGCGQDMLATTNALAVSPAADTSYYARSRDPVSGCESAECAVVVVAVDSPPTITMEPTGAELCSGESHVLCVTVEGTEPIGYRWKRSGLDLLGGDQPCYEATSAGTYWCVVGNDCGTQTSESVTITVATPPPGDIDGDCDVDLQDYASLAECLFGPGVFPQPFSPPPSAAECLDVFDVDADGDVDLADFSVLQAVMTDS